MPILENSPFPPSRDTAPLIGHLGRLRRRLRLALGLHALGLLIAVTTGAILLLVLGDYRLDFPGWLRLVLLGAFLAVFLGLVFGRLLRALRRPLPDRFLAARVEQAAALAHDELLSAVDFLERNLTAHNALAAQSVRSASQAAEAIDISRSLNFKPVRRILLVAIAGLVAMAGLALVRPADTAIAWQRWIHPLAHCPWPLHERVELVWNTASGAAPSVWPRGHPLTLQAVVRRGFRKSLRVWLNLRRDGRSLPEQLMTWQEQAVTPGEFEKVIVPTGKILQVRPAAGDDTHEPFATIRIVPRPRIVALQARIFPPPYAAAVPSYVVNLLSGPVHVIAGGTVELTFRTDHPLVRSGAQPQLQLISVRSAKPMKPFWHLKILGSRRAAIVFQARKSIAARLRVQDTDGVVNRRGGSFDIRVIPDAPPQVQIVRPRQSVQATPTGEIPIQIQASDDLGLTVVYLAGRHSSASPSGKPLFQIPLSWRRLVYDTASRTDNGAARVRWNLAPLKLKPGQRLRVFAEVGDNYFRRAGNGARVITHPLVHSASLLVVINSRARIESELRADLRAIRRIIKPLLVDQQQTRTSARVIRQAIRTNKKLTATQREMLGSLAPRQISQAARAAAIAGALRRIERIADRNNLADTPMGRLARRAAQQMGHVAGASMPRAAGRLQKAVALARRRNTLAKAGISTARAIVHQQHAIDIMRRLLRRLGAAGEFASLVAQTRRLLQQQEQLMQKLRSLAKKTIGISPNQLPPKLRQALERLARRQEKMAGKADRLSRALGQAARQLAAHNQAMAQALGQAAALSQKFAISDAMRMAGQRAARNQLQQAAANQSQARRGLRAMLRALQKEQKRSLQQEISRLEKLILQVKELIRRQQAIQQATVAAPADSSAPMLAPTADRQSHLQLDTLAVAGRAGRTEHTGAAPAYLHGASDLMGKATGSLLRGREPLAVPRQNQALGALRHALADLQKALNKARWRRRLQTLEGLRRVYQKIAKRQETLLAESTNIRQLRRRRGALLRADLFKLQRDSRVQKVLVGEVGDLSIRLKSKAPVIVWLNGKISKNMTFAARRLAQDAADRAVVAGQNAALLGLDDIIKALKEQINNDRQGGGGGGGGQPPLIPPAAQLKLLKMLQLQVNQTTMQLAERIGKTTDPKTRGELMDQVRELGGIQGGLRRQMIKLIQSMNSPAGAGGR